MLITISGEPGSGKTTVAKLLAAHLGIPHVYAGDFFRQEAQRRKLSLAAFNQLCESDHSIDRALDEQMKHRAHEGDVVLEGRLAGYIARQEHLNALKIWLTASEDVRAQRVAQREGDNWQAVLRVNHERHESDSKRYREIYGWDLGNTEVYDLILSTDDQTPQSLADRLVAEARKHFSKAGPGV